MKDSDLRGSLLKAIYDLRRKSHLVNFDPLVSPDFSAPDMRRILGQLEEKGLIEWRAKPINQLGAGYITAYGTEVVEGEAQAPFTINLNPIIDARVHQSTDNSINVSSSSGVHIGDVNNVSLDIEKLIVAVDHSKVSEAEKAEAKSLLRRLLENKVVKGVLEGWIKTKFGGAAGS